MDRRGRGRKRPPASFSGGGGGGGGGRHPQRARFSSEAATFHRSSSSSSNQRWTSHENPFHYHHQSPMGPAFSAPSPYMTKPYGIYSSHLQGAPMPYAAFGFSDPAPVLAPSSYSYSRDQESFEGDFGRQVNPLPPSSAANDEKESAPMAASSASTRPENTPDLDTVAAAAYEEVLDSGNGVTVWKVVQAMLLSLKSSSLGVQPHDIPCLRKLSLLEGKVNAFIHCHVAVKRITTLYELSKDICQHEGVNEFDELGLGPLVCHPLVVQYFAPPVLADIYRITVEEVIQHLSDYLDRVNHDTVRVEDFLDFMTTERSLSSPKHLCVRIQSLGMYVSFLRRGKKAETMLASRQASLARSREMAAEEAVPSIIKRVDEFLTKSKDAPAQTSQIMHLSSDDNDSKDNKKGEGGPSKRSRKECFIQISSSSCPYPSASEERARLDFIACPLAKSNVALSQTELQDFIASWKDICKEQTVLEVLIKMLHASWMKKKWSVKKRRKQAKLFQDFPAIALLNVAVMSMKAGHWDSLYDAFQDATVDRHVVSEDHCEEIDVAATEKDTLTTAQQELIDSKSESADGLLKSMMDDKTLDNAKSNIYFSSALLAESELCGRKQMNVEFEKETAQLPVDCKVGTLGYVSSSEALQCLLKAPMLYDLSLWSHWDLIFAPSLGPLIDWLERYGASAGLHCMVTFDGTIMRIDGSATIDDFLVAAVKGSAEDVAVKLVSLVALYGGVQHAPRALLKSHASKAMEILLSNATHVRSYDGSPNGTYEVAEGAKLAMHYQSETGSFGDMNGADAMAAKNGLRQNLKQCSHTAVNFVLTSLFHVPLDFCTFAASILIPALSSVIPDATASLLSACSTVKHRSLLHEVGMTMGIQGFIDDYRSFCLAAALSVPSHSDKDTDIVLFGTAKSVLKDDRNCSVAGHHDGGKNIEVCDLSILPERQLERTNLVRADTCVDELMIKPAYTVSDDTDRGRSGRDTGKIQEINDKPFKENEGLAGFTRKELEASEFIMSIRREEFGLDAELQFKESNLLAKQHARIGRALQCLSREIYSQDSHFVLELVQNADDNNYADGVEAALVFVLQRDRIVIFNNEMGFSAANMKALCDIGNSTKAGSSAGYIGHKGIGFKSVFRVTDSPEIHSGGFHVKFDTSEGNLGFILPTIIPPVADNTSFNEVLSVVEKTSYTRKSDWNTCMVLPLKPSFVNGPDRNSLGKKFNDIHTSLLLFLHRLRCIVIKNELSGSLRFMQRRDLQDGLVTVLHSEGGATWFVVKRHLEAAVFRTGVQSTEIAVAFPLRELPSGEYEALCEQQEVFAFLPLRSYGLKFIVQGDFILPTSREEVDCDSAWNQWLLSEIPGVCIQAVGSFKELPMFKQYPGKAATALMSFIPLDGEVQGFFSSLPRMIFSSLRGYACLPIDNENVEWVLPCMVLGGWNSFCRMLLPDILLKEHLGLRYLHRDVIMNPVLASSLDVHMYGPETLVRVMESLCSKKGALNSLGPCWIGSWLVAIYRCLSANMQATSSFVQDRKEADLIKELQCLPFIPLSNGIHTSLREGPIWLPSGAVDSKCELEHFSLLYTELRIIHPLVTHPLFVENESLDVKSQDGATLLEFTNLIRNMLQRIGIGEICAHEVVHAHIFPSLASDHCMEKEPALVLEYLAFVRFHLLSDCVRCRVARSKILLYLRKIAIVCTNNGLKRTENEFLHFGPEFGCLVKVDKILHGTGLAWNQVDVAYLKVSQGESEPDEELSNWRIFFKELGITDFVKVVQVDKKISNKFASAWKDISWEEDGVTEWVVHDWECPELVRILEDVCKLEAERQKFDACCQLLSALSVLWESCYSGCRATYSSIAGTGEERETEPSFVLQMRKFPWIKSSLDGKLHYPAELFYRCSAVETILGNNAPYAMPQIESKGMVTALGLHTDVFEKHILELLNIWNQQLPIFEASMEQMTRLYSLLWSKIDNCRDLLLKCFKNQSCIFVPSRWNTGPEQVVPGAFLSVGQVCWSDKTGCLNLLLKLRFSNCEPSNGIPFRELSTLYPSLHGFFVTECGVCEMLELRQLLSILKLLTNDYSPCQIGKQVMEILINWFEEIDHEQLQGSQVSEWKALLEDTGNNVLPTVQNKWVSANKFDGLLCWCDNKDLGKEFADCSGVYYLQIDVNTANTNDNSQTALSFLQRMAIPRLTEMVQREPIVYGAQNSEQLLDLLNWALPYVQRYLCKWHLQHYHHLQEASFVNRIKGFRCIVVDKLYFRYTLPGSSFSGGKRTKCDYLLQGETLYVTQFDNLNLLYLEFSCLFFHGRSDTQLANFLHLITLTAQSGLEAEVEALVNAQGIPHLPDGEQVWTIDPVKTEEQNLVASNVKSRPSFLSKESKPKKRNRNLKDNVWPPRHWHSLNAFKSIQENELQNMKIIDMQLHSKTGRETHDKIMGNVFGEHNKVAFWGDAAVHNAGQSEHGTGVFKTTGIPLVDIQQELPDSFVSEDEQRNALGVLSLSPGNMLKESDHVVSGSVSFREREQLLVGQPSELQQESTGRLGEFIVFKHLIRQYGAANVRWLNQNAESGSSYDLVVNMGDGRNTLIEVKATLSEDKDWFEITQREWEVAVKEGERFMIIRVFLSSSLDSARLLWLANPVQLCQDHIIKLAIIIPNGYNEQSQY